MPYSECREEEDADEVLCSRQWCEKLNAEVCSSECALCDGDTPSAAPSPVADAVGVLMLLVAWWWRCFCFCVCVCFCFCFDGRRCWC